MRTPLLALILSFISCSRSDDQTASASSTQDSPVQSATASSTPSRSSTVPTSPQVADTTAVVAVNSSGPTAADVARWREGAHPDKIDTLMAEAFSAEGDLTETEEDYGFLSSDPALIKIGRLTGGIPRFVECLRWDQRARAHLFDGYRVLVGVLCTQGILRSAYGQRIAKMDFLWPPNIDNRSSIADFRRAQSEWRKTLLTQPPE